MEIDRALASLTETLNAQGVEEFDRERMQEVAGAELTVDDGGGLHDGSGARVGCLRRTSTGEWIADRQNTAAPNAGAEVPAPAPGGEQQ